MPAEGGSEPSPRSEGVGSKLPLLALPAWGFEDLKRNGRDSLAVPAAEPLPLRTIPTCWAANQSKDQRIAGVRDCVVVGFLGVDVLLLARRFVGCCEGFKMSFNGFGSPSYVCACMCAIMCVYVLRICVHVCVCTCVRDSSGISVRQI